MNPRGPAARRLVVDCTVALEVTVQFNPTDGTEILNVEPDWTNLKIGLPYWLPTVRRTNVGVDAVIRNHLELHLPRELELRHHPRKPQ